MMEMQKSSLKVCLKCEECRPSNKAQVKKSLKSALMKLLQALLGIDASKLKVVLRRTQQNYRLQCLSLDRNNITAY